MWDDSRSSNGACRPRSPMGDACKLWSRDAARNNKAFERIFIQSGEKGNLGRCEHSSREAWSLRRHAVQCAKGRSCDVRGCQGLGCSDFVKCKKGEVA